MQTFTSNLTPDAQRMIRSRGLGSLADRMGIEFLELSAEHSVATMPAEGNMQPFGLIHGGAYVVLAETLGRSRRTSTPSRSGRWGSASRSMRRTAVP